MGKRFFDVVVTLLMFPFVIVLGMIIALAIRLDSPGKPIFRQKRVGENGRLFEMLKFRTMVAGAEKLRHTVEQTGADGGLLHKASTIRRDSPGALLAAHQPGQLPFANVLRRDEPGGSEAGAAYWWALCAVVGASACRAAGLTGW
jgi:hypothetical protein